MADMTLKLNVALFIDADNAPYGKLESVLAELASLGAVSIRRAYGNWKKPHLEAWVQGLHEHAIQPVQQFDLIKGKNATDMAMAVDAMDVLFNKPVDVFCIVSSDCDFTPLVMRVRAEGKQVIGFGERKTPESFVNACSRFVYLDPLNIVDQSELQQPAQNGATDEKAASLVGQIKRSGNTLKGDTKLMNLLRNAVASSENEEGWAPLGVVGSRIGNQASFDSRNYGYAKLSDLFGAIDLFETKRVGNQLMVRYKRRVNGG
ncbi:MAG: NYN domain-containing protein [Alcaligenaceae bacterium]|nr:NYN domain-containing protein [Alcaligenaceae bacterium]